MPERVIFSGDKKIKKIYAGYAHSMAIAEGAGIVFVWGDGKAKQLPIQNSDTPFLITELNGKDIIKG
jgi:hypothetical protein